VTPSLHEQQRRYAELLLKIGLNLQPGQPLIVMAELAHAEFARIVNEAAHRAGAKYVHVAWAKSPWSMCARR
jgi:aminopeptidase